MAANDAINTSSSSNGSVSSLPLLVRPPVHEVDSLDVIPSYQLESQSEVPLFLQLSETQHVDAPQNLTTSSESAAGLSDATTANLESDVDTTEIAINTEPVVAGCSHVAGETSERGEKQPSRLSSRKRSVVEPEGSAKKAKCGDSSGDTSNSTKDTSSSLSADASTSTSDTSSSTHQGGAASQNNKSLEQPRGGDDVASPGSGSRDNADESLPVGQSSNTHFSDELKMRSVYRRSDCAELNVWSQKPLHSRQAGGTTNDQDHATSSQRDFLFDAIDNLPVRIQSSQPFTSTNIYLSLSCVPPSQDYCANISRIRPTSPTDISALIESIDNNNQMNLKLSESQISDTQGSELRIVPQLEFPSRLQLRDSDVDPVDLCDDGQIVLSTADEDTADRIGTAHSSQTTTHFLLDRPVTDLLESENSSTDGNPTSSALVFKKNLVVSRQSCVKSHQEHAVNFDLDLDLNIADSPPLTKSLRNVIYRGGSTSMSNREHSHQTENVTRGDVEINRESLSSSAETRVCRDSVLISAADFEQTVLYDAIDEGIGVVSNAIINPVIESHIEPAKEKSNTLSIVQSSKENPEPATTAVDGVSGVEAARLGSTDLHNNNSSHALQIRAVGDKPLVRKTMFKSGTRAVVGKDSSSSSAASNLAVEGLCRRSQRVAARKTKCKQRKKSGLRHSHLSYAVAKYSSQVKSQGKLEGERLIEGETVAKVASSPAVEACTSAVDEHKQKTSQAVQTSLTKEPTIICKTTKFVTILRRTIVITEEIVGGKVVSRKMNEKTETLKEDNETHEEILSPLSEIRSLHSSADLADISSLSVSSSTSTTHRRVSSTPMRVPIISETPTLEKRVPVAVSCSTDGVIADSLVAESRSRSSMATREPVDHRSNPNEETVPDSLDVHGVHRPFAAIFSNGALSKDCLDQSKSSSDGRLSEKRRSSAGLFSADSSDSLNRRSLTLSKCITDNSSEADKAIFRLPLPFPALLSKRSSTGSSGSRRSIESLSERNSRTDVSNEKSGSDSSKSQRQVQNVQLVVDPIPENSVQTMVQKVNSSPTLGKLDFQPDQSVFAQWNDKHYYPATVVSVNGRNKIQIRFDEDASITTVKSNSLVGCDRLPVGLGVMAKHGETDWREPAEIMSHATRDGQSVDYNVRYDSSDAVVRVARSKISLDKGQMAKLIEFLSSGKVVNNNAVASPVHRLHSGDDQLAAETDTQVLPPETSVVTEALPSESGGCANPLIPVNIRGDSKRVLSVGSAVYAAWKDKYFYPGHVTELATSAIDQHQRWAVSFEDGDRFVVDSDDILVCELLPLSVNVLAQRTSTLGYQEAALIVGHYNCGEDIGYVVEFLDDKVNCRVKRKDVSLHPSHAMALMNSLGASSVISNQPDLQNEFDARNQHVQSTPKHSSNVKRGTPKTSSVRVKKNASQVRTVVGGRPSGIKRKLLDNLGPGAMSTSTSPVTVKLHHSVSSPKTQEKRRTPSGKSCSHLNRQSMFADYTFIITYVRKSGLDTSISLSGSSTPGNSVSTSFNEDLPFCKEDLYRKIKECGGSVLEKFDLESVSRYFKPRQIPCFEKCFLISDRYQRTQKYFLALAAGIPCVSHLWVHHSYDHEVMQAYEAYLLPAGFSLETNQVVECNNTGSAPLAGLLVVLASENDGLKIWLDILETAGCHVLTRLTSQLGRKRPEDRKAVDVIVADRFIGPATLRQAQRQAIPLVSTEWVVQCLISGTRLPFVNHEKYSLATA